MARIRFTDIPRYFKGLPHQIAALNFLQSSTPDDVQAEFAEIWRAAVSDKVQDVPNSWAGVMQAAKEAGARYPSLVAAQWAIESGWGKHFTGTNNAFGQKGSPGTLLKPSEGGPPVEFLNFPSLRASVQYLVDRWHKDFKNYPGVNRAPNREAAAQSLMDQGYVGIPPQNPEYANTLIRLMRENAPLAQVPPPAKVTPSSPFSIHLTPHIRLGEFALDQEARRFKAQHQIDTAGELAAFLERVRVHFGGRPVVITSGYRPPDVNRAVGGAAQSEHLYSVPREGAVDFIVEGANMAAVEAWCEANWPMSLGRGAHKGFVHIGRRADGARRRWDY